MTARGRRQTYVALLRGVNLGARNKVAMPALRALFEELGAEDVETYVQSGNVVYRSPSAAAAASAETIEAALSDRLGVTSPVLLRSTKQLLAVVKDNPFAERAGDPKHLHVTFLAEAPARTAVRALDPERFAPDELSLVRREVYLHCPNGYGRTKLTNAYFEKQLGVIATTRNWRTVTTLGELANARS